MVLRELKLKRFQTKKSRIGYFSFGTKVREKEFIYLKSNPSSRKSIETWKNNFYGAYKLDDNYLFLSIEGISLFDSSFKHRRDMGMERNSETYSELRKRAKHGKLSDLEVYLKEIMSKRKL